MCVFYAGDSGFHPEWSEITRRSGPFDLTILPIGAYEPRAIMAPVHMNPGESVRAWQLVTAAQRTAHGADPAPMMGVHWGTYKLTDEPMDEPPRLTRALWAGHGLPAELLWTPAHGETRTFRAIERAVTP